MRGKRHTFTILRPGEPTTDADGRRTTVDVEVALGKAGTIQSRFADEETLGHIEADRLDAVAGMDPDSGVIDTDHLRVENAGNLSGTYEVLAIQPTERTMRVFLKLQQ